MEYVLREDFGRVTNMDAQLYVCPKDLPLVGVNQPPLPIGENQGCIRRLGRYCVLFSILLFSKFGSHPISAQVHTAREAEDDGGDDKPRNRELTHATGTVKYSNVRLQPKLKWAEGVSSSSYDLYLQPQNRKLTLPVCIEGVNKREKAKGLPDNCTH